MKYLLIALLLLLTGCNSSSQTKAPVTYLGEGTISDNYKIYENGLIPVHEGDWTYYEITSVNNTNCTYRLSVPIYVTNCYIYDDDYNPITYRWDSNLVMFDVNSSVYFDCYSLLDGEIELYSDCFEERR